MTCDQITLLLADYESGRLPAADVRRVQDHLAGCPACRRELELQRQLDLAIKQEAAPEPGAHVQAAFHAWLKDEVRSAALPSEARSNVIRVSFWNHPAAVSGLVAIAACAVFALGLVVGSRSGPAGDPAATAQMATELVALREQVSSMRQAVAWNVLQQENAGDRLRTVRAMAATPLDGDPAAINKLLGILAYDNNGQVRQSAVQALYRFADVPTVRTAVARALVREPSPAVQLEMIDLLATTGDPEAAAALETLVHNESQNPLVREAATYALTRM